MKITSGDDTFELVDFVPFGYEIWNIGRNMIDGYVPLCRISAIQPFPGGRNIEVNTLKAIKADGAQVILAAIGYGPKTVAEMEKHIYRYRNAKSDSLRYDEVRRMKKALPYMRKLKWEA